MSRSYHLPPRQAHSNRNSVNYAEACSVKGSGPPPRCSPGGARPTGAVRTALPVIYQLRQDGVWWPARALGHPGRRCARYPAAGLNGPQRWSTVRRHDRRGPTESAAGQRFLIGDASLGWNPSVRSTIQHASRISNRVLPDTQRHQQTEAANKQPTRTSRSRQPTWRKLWGRTVRSGNLNPQRRDLSPACVHR
jgi:hypothetical protein